MGWDAEEAEAQYWESSTRWGDDRVDVEYDDLSELEAEPRPRLPTAREEIYEDYRPAGPLFKTMADWFEEHKDVGRALHSARSKEVLNIQLEGRSVTASIAERKDALRRQQEELAIRLEKLSRIPTENPFQEGEIGRLVKTFASDKGVGYTYGFLHVAGRFYTTGRRQGTQVFNSWDDFANWIGEGTWKIERATAWEDVSA
jgi:hypothetical protein